MKYFVKIISVALLFMIAINAFSPIAYSDYYSEKTTINSDVKIEPVLNNHIRSLLSDIIGAPEAFGYSLSDFYDCYFGKPFTIDCYSQQSDIGNNTYIPIINQNGVFALITITKDGNDFCVSISKSFAKRLNECINANSGEIALIFINDAIVAINENSEAYFLSSFDLNEDEFEDPKVLFGNVANKQNCLSEYSLKTDANESSKMVSDIIAENKVLNTRTTNYLANYPLFGQPGNCWASVVCSMVAYEMGNTPLWLTEQYLCDQLYIQSGHGATTEEIIDSLELNLPSSGNYIPTQTYSVLSQSDITTVIGNLDPACMLMLAYRNGSNSGTIVKKHTCALYGYSFTNSISKIYVMEPHNYEKILVTKTGSNYIIPIEQYNFYWEDTIRLYYNL